MYRVLGVDVGIASIGWALIEFNNEKNKENRLEILDSGVRIFTKAENPNDKSSLALPRRNARSVRRRNRRRAARMQNIKKYLAKIFEVSLQDIQLQDHQNNKLPKIFQTSKTFISPWELRKKALDMKLENFELIRIILHIAKRRGYDDITYGIEEKESGEIKKAIDSNYQILKKYRSIGEMMYQEYYQKIRADSQNFENIRNRALRDDKDKKTIKVYRRCVGRSELKNELKLILEKQREFGNMAITQDFITTLLGKQNAKSKQEQEGLIFYQRSLKGFEGKVGKCQFFSEIDRACKYAPSAEKFIALTKIINTLYNISHQTGIVWDMQEMVAKILQEVSHVKSGLTYAKLRKILKLPETFQFKELQYSEAKVENKKFIQMETRHKLLAVDENFDIKIQDKITEILSINKDWKIIEKKFQENGLTDLQIQRIKEAKLNFSKTINLSLKALYLIIPLMEEGKRYDEAVTILQKQGELCQEINNFDKKYQNYLPSLEEIAKKDKYFDITNPVVLRALTEFRKVVNAILKEHGAIHYFNLELTREIGASKAQRKEMEKKINDNRKINQQAINICKQIGLEENDKNILKCKLWHLQKEICLYSGKKITIDDLKDSNCLEIDHFIPRSRSLDNSQSNKVLCFKHENQSKGNKIPYEYFGNNEEQWLLFSNRVKTSLFDKKKKEKLLLKTFKDRNSADRIEFLTRNLVDTSYIARAVSLYIKKYLDFLPLPNQKTQHLRIISGSLVSAMRSYWGIDSKNRKHHLHHVQDAIIIACINQYTIQKYSDFLKERELSFKDSAYKKQKLSEADYVTKLAMRYPVKDFKSKIDQAIEKIIVSHHVSQKVSGALHEDTVYKREFFYELYDGEEGVQKAIALGKVREVNGGLVRNKTMVRVDIFKNKSSGKFYWVPIYTFDVAMGILPNKATSSKKNGLEWIEMDEAYEFCFSLFKNDCVLISQKEMQEPVLAIFKSADISNMQLEFEHHSKFTLANQSEKIFFKESFIVRTSITKAKIFTKLKVSVLGRSTGVKPARRLGFKQK